MSEAAEQQGQETRVPVLTARNVVRRFGGLVAVNDVSFDVRAGEILGLIGPNGAGKTTMIDLLAGSILPTSGDILLNGTRVSGEAAHLRIGRGLGRTFQIPRPLPNLTLIENIMLAAQGQAGELLANFCAVAGRRRGNRRKALNCWSSSPSPILRMSRRGCFPAASASARTRPRHDGRPAIILLDNRRPSSTQPCSVIIDRIRDINARHHLPLIEQIDMVTRLCHRVLVMASGQLLSEGTADGAVTRACRDHLGGTA